MSPSCSQVSVVIFKYFRFHSIVTIINFALVIYQLQRSYLTNFFLFNKFVVYMMWFILAHQLLEQPSCKSELHWTFFLNALNVHCMQYCEYWMTKLDYILACLIGGLFDYFVDYLIDLLIELCQIGHFFSGWHRP